MWERPAAACSLPSWNHPSCPTPSPVRALHCPPLPTASLMLKYKKCPKTLRFCFQAVIKQAGPCGKAVAPGRMSLHLFPFCPLLRSEMRCWGPGAWLWAWSLQMGRRVDVPCMKCGLLLQCPRSLSSSSVDCSLPISQTLQLPWPLGPLTPPASTQHFPLGATAVAAVTDSQLWPVAHYSPGPVEHTL